MRKADGVRLLFLLRVKFTYSKYIEIWAMFLKRQSFDEKMMYSFKSMHDNTYYWSVTSGVVCLFSVYFLQAVFVSLPS